MKTKIAISTLVIVASFMTHAVAEPLKIYLPREVNIDDEIMLLGDITLIRGNQEDIAKASTIQLGKFSMPGQQITVTRSVILGRLTANHINTKNVLFTGAKDINVGRKEVIISPNEIIAQAEKFLKDNKSGSAIASYVITRSPQKIVLSSKAEKVKLVPRLKNSISATQTTVEVDVMLDGKKIGTDYVSYRPAYNSRRVVAITNVKAGEVISSNNIKIETVLSRYPERSWKSPIGLVAKRNIKSGQLIYGSLLANAKPEILIKRSAFVAIKISTAALSITANGQAMENGAFGETIRVRNVDSKKVIICKVNFDGTVSPVM